MAIDSKAWIQKTFSNFIDYLKPKVEAIDAKLVNGIEVTDDKKVKVTLKDGSSYITGVLPQTPLATDDEFNAGTSTTAATTVKQVATAIAAVDDKTPVNLSFASNKLELSLKDGSKLSTDINLDYKIEVVVDKVADLPAAADYANKWAIVKEDTDAHTEDNGIYFSDGDNWNLILGIPQGVSIEGNLSVVTDVNNLPAAVDHPNDFGIVVDDTSTKYYISDGSNWNLIKEQSILSILASDNEFQAGTATDKAATVAQVASLFTDDTTVSTNEFSSIWDNSGQNNG